MSYRQREEGWTVVRRGRNRQNRTRAVQPPNTFHSHNFSAYGQRRSYADVTKSGRDMRRGGVHNFKEPGYKPQFFEPRTHYGPVNKTFKNNKDRTDNLYKKQTPKQTYKESGNPDFKVKIRTIHNIIKAAHHLKNVSGTEPPVTIGRLTRNLSTVIKPAAPNTATQTLIEGNAKNWAYTTLLILRDHHALMMEAELDKMSGLPPGDWREPFQVASLWARRNLGRRLQDETLEQVEAQLIARLSDVQPTTAVRGEDSTAPQTHTTQGTATTQPKQPPPGPLKTQKKTQAQIHTHNKGHNNIPEGTGAPSRPPNPPVHTTTTGTNTEPLEEIASVSEVEEETHVSPTPSQAPKTSPKPQRAKRAPSRKTGGNTAPPGNPSVVPENSSLLDLSSDELESFLEEERPRTPTTGCLLPMETPLTPLSVRRLETAVQSQITLGSLEQDPTPVTPETPTRKPTRHLCTKNKMQDWSLSVGKKWLIMGDSNLSRVPPFTASDLQIDSYPGATFRHAGAILARATSSVEVETVILSFGLNNRSQNVKQTTVKQLQRAVRTAKLRFPQAVIWVPEVNYSRSLPRREQNNILHLNAYITKNCRYIPELPMRAFKTEPDNIHWTKPTARRILQHWFDHVK